MPGAWESIPQNNVLTCIIHTDTTTIAWAIGLKNLITPGPISTLSGMPYDHARNVGVQQMLDNEFEWLFFLDSDVIAPHDTILRLRNHRRPIVSGIYYRRSPPAGLPVMIKHGTWYANYPSNTVIDVDYVGAGCLLLHRTVLERLPPSRPGKPWFDWRVDLKGHGICPDPLCLSEDFAFCHQARSQGIKVLVDTSIQCKHIGFSEANQGRLDPLDTRRVG